MRFAARVHALRWFILLVWGGIIVAGLSHMDRIAYDSDVLVYFDNASPERQDFEILAERFGRSNEIVTLIVPDQGSALGAPGLAAMARLTAAIDKRGDAIAIRSALSATDATPDAVLAMDDAGLARLAREIAQAVSAADDDFGPFLANDESIAAVAAIVESPPNNDGVQTLAAEYQSLKEAVEAASPGVTLLQTGRIVIDAAFLTEGQNDVDRFAGAQFLIMLGLLFAAFGSVSIVCAMAVLIFAILAAILGTIGATGIAINGISSATPAVLMGLLTATAVHFVMAWQHAIRHGADRRTAIAVAYDRNWRPVVISLATTLISFLVLNIAESPPFRQLGNLVALGLVFTLVIVFTLLPALLSILPKSRGRHRIGFEHIMGRLGATVASRWRTFLTAAALAGSASVLGAASISVDDTFSHYFDETYEVRRATDLFENKLSGTTIIDLSVDLGAAGNAYSEATLLGLERMTAWLAARPDVAATTSLIDARERTADAPLDAVVDALARAGMPRVTSRDGRHTRISIVMRGVSSRDTLALAAAAEAEARRLFPLSDIIVTGIPILSAQLSVKSTNAMFIGMGLALAAISALIMATLKSMRLGLVSLAPNLLPVTIAFGLWGAFAGEISFAATVVGALTYGIVVDDTVHILANYRRLRDTGAPAVEAIAASFRSVGIAVLVTSCAIGLSYLPFATSGFLVNHHFGALTALTLFAALVADLFFLPAMLAALDRWPPKRARRVPVPVEPATVSPE